MFRYDTHVHTSETSPCGNVSAADTVRLYAEAGYSGICITDHYTDSFFAAQEGDWTQKTDAYLQGYRNAVEAAKAFDFQVFLGTELRLSGANNEYLLYGVTEPFFYDHPALYALDMEGLFRLAKTEELLVYQAHPFRPGMTRAEPALLDGVEVFNGNPRHNSRNEEAYAFANEHGLGRLSGSDCHEIGDVARGGIIVPEKLDGCAAFLDCIKQQAFERIGM